MRILISLLALTLLFACGHKGPVVPLGEKLPAAPDKLTALQRGDSFLLSWSIPTSNQDGSRLDDLQGFDVLRMDFASDTPCETCRDTSRRIHFVDLEFMQASQRSGDQLFFVDRDIEMERAYRYHLVAVTGDKHRGQRATIDVTAQQPPLAPQNLQGEGLDRLVRLSWDEADLTGCDCNLLGYLVYRAESGAPFPLTPLQNSLVVDSRFEDLGVANDKPLRYAIRTVLLVGEQEVQSHLSEEIVVTPRPGR